jgi:hypothetical protein
MNNSGSWIIQGLRLLQRQGSDSRSRIGILRVDYDEVDAVRLARPEGKNCRAYVCLDS